MGLDQYLYAEKYVSGHEFTDAKEKLLFSNLTQLTGLTATEQSPHINVYVCVAYWRKANQIHKWFVDNVQDGRDDCKEYWVSRESLAELRDLCAGLYERQDKEEAERVLSPQAGFFFGGTDVDEYYWYDIKGTVEQLTNILDDPSMKDCEFHYRASW